GAPAGRHGLARGELRPVARAVGGRAAMSGVVFARVGAATPLGLSASATACAVAAGVSCFRDSEVAGSGPDPIKAAWLRSPDAGRPRVDRLLFFATRALAECVDGLPAGAFTKVPVYLALPEPKLGAPLHPAEVVAGLSRAAPAGLSLDFSARPSLLGRAAFF